MLDIATSFCSSRDIKVNTEKTFSVVFSKNGSSCDPQLYINNNSLDGRVVRVASKSECTHLGHKLTSDLNQSVDIGYQRNVFIRRANGILATFGQLRSDIRTVCYLYMHVLFMGVSYGLLVMQAVYQGPIDLPKDVLLDSLLGPSPSFYL